MYQSAAPTSFRLLYDEKRDKKETEYGSEILRVNNNNNNNNESLFDQKIKTHILCYNIN